MISVSESVLAAVTKNLQEVTLSIVVVTHFSMGIGHKQSRVEGRFHNVPKKSILEKIEIPYPP